GDIATIIYKTSGNYVALDGKTGKLKFTFSGSGSQEVAAVADLDKDGIPEIIVKNGSKLTIYNNKGVVKKEFPVSSLSASGWSSDAYHPNVADLDKDGIPEIIINNKVINYEKGVILDNLLSGQTQAIADVNGDGQLDIIGLQGAVDLNGNLLYRFKNKNGSQLSLKFLAIGDVLGSS